MFLRQFQKVKKETEQMKSTKDFEDTIMRLNRV